MLPDILAGIVASMMVLTYCTVNASLVFSSSLSHLLFIGIGSALLSSILTNVYVPARSDLKPTLCAPAMGFCALLALILANVYQQLLPQHSQEAILITLVATMTITSLTCALAIFIIGYFRLANIIRFIPQPVISGFMLIIAWLILHSGINIMAVNHELWYAHENFQHYLPGIILGGLLYICLKKFKHYAVTPSFVIIGIACAYIALSLSNTTITTAQQHGWLFNPLPQESIYSQIHLSMLKMIDWQIILKQTHLIISTIGFTIISLLLYSTSLEIIYKQQADLDKELKNQGLVNIVSSLCLGINAITALTPTLIARQITKNGKIPGIVTSIICGLILFLAPSLLTYLPKFVVGGLLIYMSLSMFIEHLYLHWFRTQPVDYSISVLILLVAIYDDLLISLGLGVLISTFIFIWHYSQLKTIKFYLSLAAYQSNVMRSPYEQYIIETKSQHCYVIKLQGYLFFGTAYNLLTTLINLYREHASTTMGYAVLDFADVPAMDGAASYTLQRLTQIAQEKNIVLIFSGVNHTVKKIFELAELAQQTNIVFQPDIDHGVEWAENKILSMYTSVPLDPANTHIHLPFTTHADYETFKKYLIPMEVPANTVLFREGDPTDSLYFLERGVASIYSDNNSVDRKKRWLVVKNGALLGEIGFYTRATRSITVEINEDSLLYKLTYDGLHQLTQEHPHIANELQSYLIKILCDRLQHAYDEVDLLLA